MQTFRFIIYDIMLGVTRYVRTTARNVTDTRAPDKTSRKRTGSLQQFNNYNVSVRNLRKRFTDVFKGLRETVPYEQSV